MSGGHTILSPVFLFSILIALTGHALADVKNREYSSCVMVLSQMSSFRGVELWRSTFPSLASFHSVGSCAMHAVVPMHESLSSCMTYFASSFFSSCSVAFSVPMCCFLSGVIFSFVDETIINLPLLGILEVVRKIGV